MKQGILMSNSTYPKTYHFKKKRVVNKWYLDNRHTNPFLQNGNMREELINTVKLLNLVWFRLLKN